MCFLCKLFQTNIGILFGGKMWLIHEWHHIIHLWTFTSVCHFASTCFFLCTFKCVFCVNCLRQISHLYGFSPVCALWCSRKLVVRPKPLPHTLHLYGFSPVCVFMCCLKFPDDLNTLPHTLHENWFCATFLWVYSIPEYLANSWSSFSHSAAWTEKDKFLDNLSSFEITKFS